jgi:hypothetical protein
MCVARAGSAGARLWNTLVMTSVVLIARRTTSETRTSVLAVIVALLTTGATLGMVCPVLARQQLCRSPIESSRVTNLAMWHLSCRNARALVRDYWASYQWLGSHRVGAFRCRNMVSVVNWYSKSECRHGDALVRWSFYFCGGLPPQQLARSSRADSVAVGVRATSWPTPHPVAHASCDG